MQTDPIVQGLMALIRSALGGRLDYYALYPARVVAQDAGGDLDLVPDDSRLPSYQGVPIRYGVPGVAATVAPGARVLLGFAGGDPSKPMAELWESASVTKLTVDATLIQFQGGLIPVAKELSPLVGTAGPFPISGTVAPGGGSQFIRVP